MDSEVESESGAEQAFDNLTAEVAALRRSVEALPGSRPKDYAPTLGAIAQNLETLTDTLQAIEQHPVIRMTPAQHNQFLAGAGERLVGQTARKLESAAYAAEKDRRELAMLIGTVRGQRKQWEWLAWLGVSAFFFGLLISPVFARVLPFGWDGHIAAFIMNADRWTAGSELMEAGNPEAWRIFRGDYNLVKGNQDALATCRDAAAKAKREQHCNIIVAPPSLEDSLR